LSSKKIEKYDLPLLQSDNLRISIFLGIAGGAPPYGHPSFSRQIHVAEPSGEVGGALQRRSRPSAQWNQEASENMIC